MTFLPIVERELRARARRPSLYWIRTVAAAVGLLLNGSLLVVAYLSRDAQFGGMMFRISSGYAFVLCLLGGAVMTSDCLSEEKREGTLGLLFLTDLRGYDVVLGKFIARAWTAFSALAATFPLMGLPLLIGGVTGEEFWRMVLALLNALFVSCAVGTVVSSFVWGDRGALAMGLASVFVVTVLPAGVLSVAKVLGYGSAAWAGSLEVLEATSPWTPLAKTRFGGGGAGGLGYGASLAVSHGVGWLCLAVASWRLPRSWQDERASRTLLRRLGTRRSVGRGGLSGAFAKRAPILDADPLAWLTLRDGRTAIGAWVVVSIAVAATFLLFWRRGGPGGATFIASPAGIVSSAGFGLLILKILVGSHVCRLVVEARKSGAIELILCAPLSDRDLVHGQWIGLKRRFLWPVLVLVAISCVPVVSWILDPQRGGGGFAGLALGLLQVVKSVEGVLDVGAIFYVGIWAALVMEKPNWALAATLAIVLVAPSVLFLVPNVVISVVILAVAKWQVEKRFRSLAMHAYARRQAEPPFLPKSGSFC